MNPARLRENMSVVGIKGSLHSVAYTEYGTDYQPSTIKFAGEDKACLRQFETESGSSSPARD